MAELMVGHKVAAKRVDDVDGGWMAALSDLAHAKAGADTEAVLAAFAQAVKAGPGIAARITRLAQHPLDQLVLAGLFVEGQDIGLRRRLRTKGSTVYLLGEYELEDDDEGPAKVLSAASLVEWLGGDSEAWRGQVAQRLLPQAGLAARSLVLRGSASTPLEGGVRLTPFLASLLYPGDGGDERRLDSTLILTRPKERLTDVVLKAGGRAEIESFIRLCRSKDGPGRAALLWGRAGTGKTLTARAIAGELGLPLLQVRTMGSDREPSLLERAAAAAVIEGAALFFDECGRLVDSETQKHGPPPEAAMLLEILQDHPGVIVAAMNQGWMRMSQAFQRRFQFQVVYQGPEPEERTLLWKKHLLRPAAEVDVQQIAKRFPLNGGLIKNAAARLDAEDPGQPASMSELEEASRSQLTQSLEWSPPFTAEWKLSRLMSGIDRECRRELAGLGLRIRQAVRLAVKGTDANYGFKACLWRDGGLTSIICAEEAAVYVAKIARLKPVYEALANLGEKDTGQQKQQKSVMNLRLALSAAFMTGHLPILRVEKIPDGPNWMEKSGYLSDFEDFTGAGLVITGIPHELAQKIVLGEWVRVRKARISNLTNFLGSQFRGVEFERLDETLTERIAEYNYAGISTIVRWAMTRDPGALESPPRVSTAAIAAALNAYVKKPGTIPVFHG